MLSVDSYLPFTDSLSDSLSKTKFFPLRSFHEDTRELESEKEAFYFDDEVSSDAHEPARLTRTHTMVESHHKLTLPPFSIPL